ncbi:hypothetical protein CAOG_08393 [Capsaspora owczarzaki ATCC 30864]|uniref:GSKIP domain-containing protein n=1 Tax=Capsaspora owczarzaki (strain ATCC 30864) TaxID=595528 RepID=A0A0D2X062_CAPO3|nr:hypothetical protein CAOG_08393 [Capsaspora owczarzaki ATCC 30864]KJE88504.1 hypothetical protein CAOG_008393 [Capsaspora owczarzaki ATCC 30864]|eukprot:XP_011269963.1 hypothetical protein CAOG_08393 [Capsaspora owczarzaki ATCC 30864]
MSDSDSNDEADRDIQLIVEANDIVKDAANHVTSIAVSSPATDDLVTLVLTTLEQRDCRIELTVDGLKIISMSGPADKAVGSTFESIQALLSCISPKFRGAFAGDLASRLAALAESSQ